MPIATGERLLLAAGTSCRRCEAGVAVVQPDLSHAGGISEVRRIAALAETYGASLAPHCPLGPIALAASLQVAFATPNFLIQEQSLGIHYNAGTDLLDYLVDPSRLHVPRRLRRTVAGARPRHRGRRGRGARGRPHRARLAHPVWRHDRRLVRGVVSPHIAGWQQQPLQLTSTSRTADGGRRCAPPTGSGCGRGPTRRRTGFAPGDRFVDAGGLEECFPTVRGTPDHGGAWSAPWSGADHDAHVAADGLRLRRRLDLEGGAVTARYDVDGPPGQPFVHASNT